jgi:sulfur carrier protein ThiS
MSFHGLILLARRAGIFLLVHVKILPGREEKEVEARNVAELLKALELHSDAHLVVRDDQILTRDVRLGAEDRVEIWPVISGGGGR